MNVETNLCKTLADLFQDRLDGIAVHGNWIVDNTAKGVSPKPGPKLEISVKPRRYDGYSSPMAEIDVRLDCDIPFASDATLSRTVDAYDRLSGILETYHRDFAAVKRDLTVVGFTPVGFRFGGENDMSTDPETKTRYFTLQFTIKGRITK